MAMMDRAKQNLDQVKENIGKFSEKVTKNEEHREGFLTRAVEEQTAKVPSIGFLGFAVASMVGSALLTAFAERKEFGNFVGLWAPTFLLMGIYNKMVKLEGSDRSSQNQLKSRLS